jgi:hypothetical protein
MLTTVNSTEPDLRFALRPNCLITRRPLVFLTPPRSLFFYKNTWSEISHILHEHGYKVEIFQLPFQNIHHQIKIIQQHKNKLKHTHIFVDPVTYQNLKQELFSLSDSTITVIGDSPATGLLNDSVFNFKPDHKQKTLSYFLHQKWCQILGLKTPDYSELLLKNSEKSWHSFLDHCVFLAEIDYNKD